MTPQQSADLAFMALVLWREARGESLLAKVAVACSVMNRVWKPCWWGTDVASVLFKKWQYSSVTDPHDPQLTTWPRTADQSWQECLTVADGVLAGRMLNPVKGADSYHDTSISPPKWATPESFVAQIGNLLFYDTDHDHEAEVTGHGPSAKHTP